MNGEMRKHALRRYLVFRVKVVEFLDLGAMRQKLLRGNLSVPNPVGRKPSDFADSLRTVQLSWFALLIDKNGMDAEETWDRIKSAWEIIRSFRDRAGFHADKPRAFFKARHEVIAQTQKVGEALDDFQKLFRTILHAEATELPDFPQAVDEFLDDMEKDVGAPFNRKEFKRYLIIPQASATAAKTDGG